MIVIYERLTSVRDLPQSPWTADRKKLRLTRGDHSGDNRTPGAMEKINEDARGRQQKSSLSPVGNP